MVAIVGGNSLGLNLTSLSTLGARGVFGNARIGGSGEQAYVNVANGNLVLQKTDDQLVSHGAGFGTVRTYNSQGALSGANTWNIGAAKKRVTLQGTLNAAGSTMIRTDQDGSDQKFTFDASAGRYKSTNGNGSYDMLSYDTATGEYVWTDGDSAMSERYESALTGRILSAKDIHSNTVVFAYASNGLLSSVTDSSGGVTYYDYSSGKLTQIRTVVQQGGVAVTQTRVRYAYDSQNRLSTVSVDLTPGDNSVADSKIYQTFYTYSGNTNRLAQVSQTDGSRLSFTYVLIGNEYKVATITNAAGEVTRYTYDVANRRTSVTDALGYVTKYEYDTEGQLVKLVSPPVNGTSQVSTFTYDASGNLIRLVEGAGKTIDYTYDARGNQISEKDNLGNTITRTYLDNFNYLKTEAVYTVAANGATAASGALTTRHIYSSDGQLRYSLTPEGRVTEYEYNGFGERTSTFRYEGGRYSLGSMAPGTTPNITQMNAWSDAADKSKRTRVDAIYDSRGMLQQTTAYASVTAAGVGVTDGTQVVTQYVYSQSGQLLMTVSPTLGTTTYVYDGLGRLISTQDALGNQTLTDYSEVQSWTIETLANGSRNVKIYDLAGRLIEVRPTSDGTFLAGQSAKYQYDKSGQLTYSLEKGEERRYMYDEAGRRIAEVNGMGALTEFRYDGSNRPTQTIRYSVAVDLGAFSGNTVFNTSLLAAIRPASVGADVVEWRLYDDAGRLSKTVDGNGAVVEHRYDGASRLVAVIRHASPVSVAAITASTRPASVTPRASAANITDYRYYSADGLLRGTVDGEGYLVEYVHDVRGREIQRISYATKAKGTPSITSTIETLRPVTSAGDRSVFSVHNALSQVIGQVDSQGYLTEFAYDGSGNLTTTVRYANPISVAAQGKTLVQLRPASNAADQVVTRQYTKLDQISSEVSAEGKKTLYVYDAMGKLVSTVLAAGTSDSRALLARYDWRGQLVGELSGTGAARITGTQTQAQIDAIWTQYGTTYGYDEAGRRTSATDAAGKRTLYYYNEIGLMTHVVNPLGAVEERRYDNLGQLVESIRYGTAIVLTGLNGGLVDDALLTAIAAKVNAAVDSRDSYQYTATGLTRTHTNALGAVVTREYDAFGNEVLRTAPVDATRSTVTNLQYDRRNLLVSTVLDPNGLANKISQSYDAFGRIVWQRDGNGNARTTEYDGLGRTIATVQGANRSTLGYDAFNNVAWQEDATGRRITYTYDKATRKSTTTTPDGISVVTTRNLHGDTLEVRDGRGNATTYTYDRDGHLLKTVAAGGTVSNTYDKMGNLAQVVDARGVKSTSTYDAVGRRLTQTVDSDGLVLRTTYAYNIKGERTTVTDPNGVATVWSYDRAGQAISVIQDSATLKLTTRYVFDQAGNTVQVTAPNGTITTYAYDVLGRRTEEIVDPSGLRLSTTYVYDGNDNVVATVNPNGEVTRFVFNAENKPVFKVDPLGGVVETQYDAAGRVTRTIAYADAISIEDLARFVSEPEIRSLIVVSASDATEYRYYNGEGRLSMTVDGVGAVVTYTFDANGNVIEKLAYANKIALSGLGVTMPALPVTDVAHDQRIRTIYDVLNRAIFSIDARGAVVQQAYDANGNIVSRILYATRIPAQTAPTQAAVTAALALITDATRDVITRNTYDKANRLTYVVDALGAVVQRIYDKNGLLVRQISFATRIVVGGDPASVTASPSDRATDWIYDRAGRQVATVDATGAATRNVYDANGNIVQTITYANKVSPTVARTSAAMLAAMVLSGNDRVRTTAYDKANRAVLSINGLQNVVETQYDAAGRAIASIAYESPLTGAALAGGTLASMALTALRARLPAAAGNHRITRLVFDAAGRVAFRIDASGFVTESSYDALGQLVKSRAYATSLSLNANPGVTTLAGMLVADAANDRVTTYVHDAAGRLLGSTDGAGKAESFTYDGVGNKRSFMNKMGRTWTYNYDATGRLIAETAPAVSVTATSVDAEGNLIVGASANVAVITRFQYDALGNLITRTEASGRSEQKVTSYIYDALGRQIRTIFPAVAIYEADTDNLLTNGASGNAVRKDGAPVSLTSDILYDVFGNAVAGRDVAGNISNKIYDANGNVLFEVDAEGYVTQYDRNAYGDVTTLVRYATRSGLSTNRYKSLALETLQAALSAANVDHSGDRVINSTYDKMGRVIEVSQSQIYAYNAAAAAGSQYFTSNKLVRTTYNAFGQAISVRELVNPVSDLWSTITQYYDKRGALAAKVDAMGYVTTFSYNAHGNAISQREYATAATNWTTAGYTLPATHNDDRVIEYRYDVLGQKAAEVRVNVEYSAASNGTITRGNLTTTYGYDAVGNQTRVTDAAGAATYSYFDAMGRLTAVAEPVRKGEVSGTSIIPLTTFKRDALGNVVSTTQHGAGTTAATQVAYTTPDANAKDRTTVVRFDSRGNQTQVTDATGNSVFSSYDISGRLAKQWRTVTGNDGNAKTWFQAYQYDKLGQQIRLLDPASTSVLRSGLTTSWSSSVKTTPPLSVGPRMKGTNTIRLAWSSLLEPAGGIVRIELNYSTVSTLHSFSTEGTNEGGSTESGVTQGGQVVTVGQASRSATRSVEATAAQAAAGMTVSWTDNNTDVGGISSLNYIRVWQQNSAGQWVSKWEGNEAAANGSGISDITQAQTGLSETALEYNAFGELISKGVDGGRQEYSEYDNVGNVIRTNVGDGVDRVILRDLQGNANATISSGGSGNGNASVRGLSIVQAANMGNQLRREDAAFDLLGRATDVQASERTTLEGGVSVKRDFTSATSSSAELYYTDSSGNTETGNESGTGETGQPTNLGIPNWRGSNRIQLGWTSLAGLGDGDIRVIAQYQSASGTVRTREQVYRYSDALSGVTMTWDGALQNNADGGVSKVTGMTVYKKNHDGFWETVISQQGTFGNTGNFVDIGAPADPGIQVRLELKVSGTNNWFPVDLMKFGDAYRYDAASLALGNYDYRVLHIARDGALATSGSGTLKLASPTLASISASIGFGQVAPQVFSWPSFGSNVNAIFNYRLAGTTAWTALPVSDRGTGKDGVNWSGMGAATYDYELLLIDRTSGAAYAHATGRITKNAAVPDRNVPPVGTPPIQQGLSFDASRTRFVWDAPGAYMGSTQFVYRPVSGGAWIVVAMNREVLVPDNESGEGGGNGSVGTVRFSVDLGRLPPGDYVYDMKYTPWGKSEPTEHTVGTVWQSSPVPGYHYTRHYNVTVPVQVWVSTPNEEGGGGYWTTEYRVEQRSEQVWVNEVWSPPGMTQSTAHYQAGYTVVGSPVSFGVTSTTGSNPRAISVTESGMTGAAATWVKVGANGGNVASRPTVLRTYDRWGNVLTVTDPRSPYWQTTYTYNADNQISSEKRPSSEGTAGAGPITRLYYDRMGRNIATRDANGNLNVLRYDTAGQLIGETHADGGVFKYDYDALGNKVQWVDAMGNSTYYTYDKLARLVLTSHDAITAHKISGGINMIESGTKTDIERVTYDQIGNKLTSTNGAGESTLYRYDLRGNVSGVKRPGIATELRTAYDTQGRKTFEADANGNAATWRYDYFGMLVAHTDIGGASYTYTYDNARQLQQQSNTRGQLRKFTYDAAGQVKQINDQATGKVSTYSYDAAGNRVRERMVQNGTVYQSNVMSYDALGRLREVYDSYIREQIDYDANGNRTRVQTSYTDAGQTYRTTDLWYGYDKMNRQTTVDGVNAALDINASQGHKITYDKNGNRMSDRYWDKTISASGSTQAGFTTETYSYDSLNRLNQLWRDGLLLDLRYYDGADRVVRSGGDDQRSRAFYVQSGLQNEQKSHTYNSAGRLINTRVLQRTDSGFGNKSNTSYNSYDAAGNVLQYKVTNWEGTAYVNTYSYTHVRYEGYREATLSGTSTLLNPGTTSYAYNVNGDLITVTDSKDASNNQTLVSEIDGKILQRTQDGKVTKSLVVNGELIATTGPGIGEDDFSPSFRPIDGGNPSASPGAYRVQAGDTLQSIAQQAFGDSRLWYLIAEANSLSGDRDLRVGQTVTVPNRVAGNYNDYKSFKPYDAGRIIGDTQPTMPMPRASGGGGCGGIGQILVIAVAVVATVYTAGTLAPLMASSGAAAAGAGVAAGATAGTSFAATMTAGVGALSGGLGFASVGVGLAAGAAGSIVSQGMGMAIGVQGKMNWSAVARSSLASGISAGIGAGARVLAGSSSVGLQTAGEAIGGSASGASATTGQLIARAALTSSVTQGVSMAVGLQSKFSWAAVAGAAAGAGVGNVVADKLRDSAFQYEMMRGFVSSAAAGTAAAVLSGGRADYVQVAVDAFGNALGNSVAALGRQGGAINSDPYGSSQARNNAPVGESHANGDAPYGIEALGTSTDSSIATAYPVRTSSLDARALDDLASFGAEQRGLQASGGDALKQALGDDIARVLRGDAGDASSGSVGHSVVSVGISHTGRETSDGGWYRNSEGVLQRDSYQNGSFVIEAKAEMGEFDRFNPEVADAARARQYGSISAYQPSIWERTGLSPEVRQVMNSTITGKVVGGILNTVGTAVAGFRSDGYNFATGKYLNPVERINTRIDTVINLSSSMIGVGAARGLVGTESRTAGSELRASLGSVNELSAAEKASGSRRTVTLYRVDDAGFAPRISLNGSVPVVTTGSGSERALFINIGQPLRAQEFALFNRHGKAIVTAVDVDISLLEALQATSVYDKSVAAKLNPGAPLRVDINKAPDQFGLRTPQQIQMLRDAINPSTVRILDPKTLR